MPFTLRPHHHHAPEAKAPLPQINEAEQETYYDNLPKCITVLYSREYKLKS